MIHLLSVKSLIKTIYYLSTNTEFLKDVTLYIGANG